MYEQFDVYETQKKFNLNISYWLFISSEKKLKTKVIKTGSLFSSYEMSKLCFF